MQNVNYAIPEFATNKDLKRVRNLLSMSQADFAVFAGTSKSTIERWESRNEKITGPIVKFIFMVENNLDYIKSLDLPKKEYPIRMYYMHGNQISTLIDVNGITQKVKIKNYTNNLIYRAFGSIENPSYDEYQEFLKSRCFPETRDKLKIVLDDLGLPFYDPFLIVKKTEGRMAEDDFWIKVED